MSRGQLKAINRLLLLQTIGTDNYLRFQLRMKLRQLRMDDLVSLCALSCFDGFISHGYTSLTSAKF